MILSRNLLAAAVATVILAGLVPDANAQLAGKRNERYNEDKESTSEAKEEARFPLATRAEPEGAASRAMRDDVNDMIKAYNADEFAEARAMAAAIIANDDAQAFERALACRSPRTPPMTWATTQRQWRRCSRRSTTTRWTTTRTTAR